MTRTFLNSCLFNMPASPAATFYMQVITLDGKTVWRRRHYRVRRAEDPGTFHFSVLDNGVISKEFWRIVHVEEDLSWGLFYYAGAASVVGQAYRGGCSITSPASLHHMYCITSIALHCNQLHCSAAYWRTASLPVQTLHIRRPAHVEIITLWYMNPI